MEPQNRIGLASLTKMAFDGIDLHPLRSQLLNQCLLERDTDGALMDLSIIEQLHGNQKTGLEWQAKALEGNRIYSINRRESGQTILLVFAESNHMGANTPVEFLLQNSNIEIITCYPSLEGDFPEILPYHDVAFCAAPVDSEKAQDFFEVVRKLTRKTGVKTINLPQHLVSFDRDKLESVFPCVEGLRVPKTLQISREQLENSRISSLPDAAHEIIGDSPLIIRPLGSHAGMGLAKIDSPMCLQSYLDERAEQEFFVSEFIDYVSPQDGNYRKYRIVFVDGEAFPCHMAISTQWDLWYLNAKMDESEDKRREEAAFMASFEIFAARHKKSFEALTAGIGLDYFGIDCAQDSEGNLVVFEADNALIVHDMDCATVFPYKHTHMKRIFAAFERMLLENCRASTEKMSFGKATKKESSPAIAYV